MPAPAREHAPRVNAERHPYIVVISSPADHSYHKDMTRPLDLFALVSDAVGRLRTGEYIGSPGCE